MGPDFLKADGKGVGESHAALFITQRLDWIPAGGFDSWKNAGENSHQHAETKCDGQRSPGDDGSIFRGGKGTQHFDERKRGGEAGQAAEDGDNDRFNQDLNKDVDGGRADGLADADFTHTLGNTGEHDVHDTDTADEQADAGNESATQSGIANEGVDLLGPVLLSAKSKILDTFVGAHEHVADLLKRFGQNAEAGDFQ